MSSGWPNKRARAYLGGDPPGLAQITAIGTGREHPFWACFCFPAVLVARSITTYLLPCVYVYFSRVGSSFLSNVLCGICKCFGCWRWVDGEFEGDAALGLPESDKPKDVRWVRASELGVAKTQKGGMKLFRGIEPNDVCQGSLGDCWLVGAMAGLAEYPSAVRNCFLNTEANDRGKYTVRLWCGRNERWELVTVDDSFPAQTNKAGTYSALFMRPNGGELWAILMEKAFAKFHGSYGALKGGFASYAWHTMTGDYVYQFHHDRDAKLWRRKDLVFGGKEPGGVADRVNHWFGLSKVQGSDIDDEDGFFQVMLKYSHKESLIGAFFHIKGGGEVKQNDGLVAGHLYSVLDVRRAGTMLGMGNGYKLIKLRNPWASGEWKGRWSDGSEEWKKHPTIAHEVNYSDANDGSFWMSFDDFTGKFTAVEICDRTTKNDLCLDIGEGDGCFGPTAGCVFGCAAYWCLCRGARTIYFGNATSDKTETKAGCCVTK